MTKIVNLEGVYNYTGTHLTNIQTGLKLAIRKRLAPTPSKPEKYIFEFGGMGYVSSLYPIDNINYSIEYQGVKYKLTITPENQGVIKQTQINVA
jgi:hypothetical protein